MNGTALCAHVLQQKPKKNGHTDCGGADIRTSTKSPCPRKIAAHFSRRNWLAALGEPQLVKNGAPGLETVHVFDCFGRVAPGDQGGEQH